MTDENIKNKFIEFLDEYYRKDLLLAANEGKLSIDIDFSLLEKFDAELADYLLENPEEVLKEVENSLGEIDSMLADSGIKLRFFNLPEERNIRIRNLRSNHIGKLILVDGIVKRASEVRPEISEAVFQCTSCGELIKVEQTGKTLKPPAQCPNCGAKKGFKLVDQKYIDSRWIVIEEPFEITSGERPSDIFVHLRGDLTTPRMQNKTDPGNRIKVTGILKELPKKTRGTVSTQMDIFIEANHIESVETEWEEIEITPEDEQKIIELAKDPKIYEKIINSIAPALYDMEDIKLAIALQLFSGEPHIQSDGSRVRGDIHILLVGDPSTAKSTIMKVASQLIPRGRYVSGKGVTAAGLTASVVRDEEFLGGWVLEAGALVLANRSLCAIDEFEKVDKQDQVALHEAMALQTISIAKANIVATLPARTAILAGGNPKFGRFDPYIPIKEQLDVPETLLSRFDLKFALRDVPDPERDSEIVDHIIKARHSQTEEILPAIPVDLFKKYVAYARKNCHPKMTEEAAQELKKFYLEMRSKATENSPIPITTRQFESLIRLAEASAKIQLRDKVTKEDALRAINLMAASLRQFGFEPETGTIDIDRAEGQKATAAQRSKIRTIIKIIEDFEAIQGKEISIDDVVREAKSKGIDNAEEIINKMLREGVLYSPKPGFISKS